VRLIVAIALLFSMTPGMAEVAEAAVHLIGHADLPHHDEAQHDEGCAEHTCTPLAHHCGCHATMSARMSTLAPSTKTSNMTQLKLLVLEVERGRVCEPPPLRPPII
jgi:hypothetical protein